jgi:NAD(P)-dependent dehydrogenase (short-subunit alcohol dehydrogenase family)
VQLGAAGATVYVTGRTTGSERSEMNRPETIEETATLVDQAGGRGIAVQIDHLVPDEVRALAHELRPYDATAVSLTPGWLRSEQMLENYGVTESNWLAATIRSPHFAISESPAFVGRAVVALAQDPDVSRWNGKSLSSGQLAKVYGFTDLDGSQPDAWTPGGMSPKSRTQANPPT